MDILLDSQIAFHTDTIKLHENYIELLKSMKGVINDGDKSPQGETQQISEELLLAKKELDGIGASMDYDQDMIWNRIRNAHPDEYRDTPEGDKQKEELISQKNKKKEEPISPRDKKEKEDNLVIPDNPNMKDTPSTHTDVKPDMEVKKNPVVTKLSKYNKRDLEKITYKMFVKARENITRLANIDPSMKENLDELIGEEADRLLAEFMKK